MTNPEEFLGGTRFLPSLGRRHYQRLIRSMYDCMLGLLRRSFQDPSIARTGEWLRHTTAHLKEKSNPGMQRHAHEEEQGAA